MGAGVPWRRFSGGADKGTLTRLVTFDEPPPVLEPNTDLRVALIAPRPAGLENLGTLEVDSLNRVLQSNATYPAEIVWHGTRLTDLEDYLSENRGAAGPHVVHFDGHGGFGRICANASCANANPFSKQWCTKCGRPLDFDAQGYLAFEGPAHQLEYVTARRFADCIAEPRVHDWSLSVHVAPERQSAARPSSTESRSAC